MHTCPNCGKDTSSGMTEPCSHCGFFPGAPAEVGQVGSSGDPSVATSFPAESPPSPTSTPAPPADPPGSSAGKPESSGAPPAKEKKNRGWVGIAIVIGLFVLGAIGDRDDNSDQTGPSASDVESALRSDAGKLGLTVTIDCPGSVAQTAVGQDFTCTATDGGGNARTVTLTNRDDRFEWSRRAFFELRALQP